MKLIVLRDSVTESLRIPSHPHRTISLFIALPLLSSPLEFKGVEDICIF